MDKRFETFHHFVCCKTFQSSTRGDLFWSSADRGLRLAPVKSQIIPPRNCSEEIKIVDNFMEN